MAHLQESELTQPTLTLERPKESARYALMVAEHSSVAGATDRIYLKPKPKETALNRRVGKGEDIMNVDSFKQILAG